MRRGSRLLRSAPSAYGSQTPPAKPSPYAWLATPGAGPSKPSGRLAGRRVAIKENISYSAAPTTCSSGILQDYHPPLNATCVGCLLDEGAEIAGMTKMDEFGMGSTTTHLPSRYSPVHNPFPGPGDRRSAGGSSGGSAAAVADGSAWAALGTDTGGSVRLPAAYCGVAGFKPSYGMISSRHGVVAYADSLDCVGVLARDVATVAEVFDALSHPDARDMTCATAQTRSAATSALASHIASHIPDLHTPNAGKPLQGLRIGLPDHTTSDHLPTPPALLDHLRSLGASLVPVSLPSLARALPAYYVLASAEASSNLARYGGGWYGSSWEQQGDDAHPKETGAERRVRIRTEGFGWEVKKRILAGTYALSADEFNNTYLKALYLRSKLRADFARVLRIAHPLATLPIPSSPQAVDASADSEASASLATNDATGVDLLLHPTAIRTAPLLTPVNDASTAGSDEYAQDALTVPASLAGLPALSVPAGTGPDGWPVGVSLVGQWGSDRLVLDVGRVVEGWAKTD